METLPLRILRSKGPVNPADQFLPQTIGVQPPLALLRPWAYSCCFFLENAEALPIGSHPDMREKAVGSSSPFFRCLIP